MDNTSASGEANEPTHRSPFKEQLAAAMEQSEKNEAMLELMRDLVYPESKDGSTLDVSFFSTIIAWHLVRCGWRPDPAKRTIKPRRLIAKGLPDNAIEWVSVDEPDSIDYTKLTIHEIRALSPRQRAIAMRALGGAETPDLPTNPGWTVQTNIHIQDAPDPGDDGYAWTGRKYR